jgi:hypothetical protein
MSIIERLTEGIVDRDMKKEGLALLDKWTRTGLLEGLDNDQAKNSMARLLENQAKELLRESSSMAAGDVEGFAAVAFPIVRRVFAGLIANELVSVQPMSLPSGLIFFLDFRYSDDLNNASKTDKVRMGNVADASIYGTDKVGSEITQGVNIRGTSGEDLSGPRGMAGYSYSSPTGSTTVEVNVNLAKAKAMFVASGSISETNAKYIKYDPDIMSATDGDLIVVLDIAESCLTGSGGTEADLDNLAAFTPTGSTLAVISTGIADVFDEVVASSTSARQARRLTHLVSSSEAATAEKAVRFVFIAPAGIADEAYDGAALSAGTLDAAIVMEFPIKDTLTTSTALGSVKGTVEWGLEGSESIPEIDIKVDSIAITAQTKKLKAKWTPELGQDLNAYHNLDAEVELTSILSEQIALEIDREILADLVNGATAGTFYWSRSPGLFVNRVTGAELGATAAAPDFTGTVSEWYETLIETINDVSAQIHIKTLRGGANFIVCSPEVANILEFTAGFRANVTADADRGDIGAVKTGSLSRKFDVMVDPYFPRNVILVGRRGSSFLESGYVYAPYVPLQVTPTIFGTEDFVPRKGVMTRYAKKMVRPDMYGVVVVRGLLGEGGAS